MWHNQLNIFYISQYLNIKKLIFNNLSRFYILLAGMPRRIPDYPDAFAPWNAICTYGSYINLTGTLLFFIIVAITFTKKQKYLTLAN